MENKECYHNSKCDSCSPLWIWYPGDWEIWLGNLFNNRRTERGAMFPPFWKQDTHWTTVVFTKSYQLLSDETIKIHAQGEFNLSIDGKLQFGQPDEITLKKGHHTLSFKIFNLTSPPALLIEGKTIYTDSSWETTYEDKIWIDENGTAHGSGVYLPVGHWHFNSPTEPPSLFHLSRQRKKPVFLNGNLIDFGQEMMGYLVINNIKGEGEIDIYYGESIEEALDHEHCETMDKLLIKTDTIVDLSQNKIVNRANNYMMSSCKAFRFVDICYAGSVETAKIEADSEYLAFDEKKSGSFVCSDKEINKIWKVSARTLDLTTREFFLDGIKRDRWTWCGDAIQSYLMNYYLRNDYDCVKRTIRQLRGKDPVTAHVNTIMDYSFYWFISIHDYYLYSGDKDFIKEMYPRMCSLMDYCLSRTNDNGFMEGQPDDWIFVDWVDFPMHKRGTLCFEQILFVRSLQTMAICAEICHDEKNKVKFKKLSTNVLKNLNEIFWDKDSHCYLHALEDGELNRQKTKFPNMMAILYGLADSQRRQEILSHVLLNETIYPITTPYMRFYELSALCQMNQHDYTLKEIKTYWGGMLREGATSFWEKYNPKENGVEHLAMYGRPYGKSLCHAWGASPIYLIGKYFLGIYPISPGYSEYEICPHLSELEWMEGSVPTPFGHISVHMDSHSISIRSEGGKGWLLLNGHRYIIPAKQNITIDY